MSIGFVNTCHFMKREKSNRTLRKQATKKLLAIIYDMHDISYYEHVAFMPYIVRLSVSMMSKQICCTLLRLHCRNVIDYKLFSRYYDGK